MFKKTCFDCGAKVDTIYEGLCEDCFKEQNPPIAEVKPINLKYCNSCKKLFYNNQLYERDEIEEKLPEIAQKNIIMNKHYKLNSVKIQNFEIDKAKVNFDIEIDCDLT